MTDPIDPARIEAIRIELLGWSSSSRTEYKMAGVAHPSKDRLLKDASTLEETADLLAALASLQAERDALRALAGKLAPEVEAIIQRVVALPPLSEKPADIKKWAERLAADVGDLTD